MPTERPIIDAIYQKLGGDQGKYRGITYNRTHCSSVEVLQTPNLWGQDPANNNYWVRGCDNCRKDPDFELPYCNPGNCGDHGGFCKELQAMTSDPRSPQKGPVCQAAGDYIHDEVYQTMIKAFHLIDISTLAPLPTGRFLASIRNAIRYFANSGRSLVIRILGGYPFPLEKMITDFIKEVTKGVPTEGHGVQLFVALAVTEMFHPAHPTSPSWNHSKIVAVDGDEAIIGGQNMWMNDYLEFAPIHDISVRVKGNIAMEAQHFLNRYWEHISLHHRKTSPAYRILSRRWVPSWGTKSDSFPKVAFGWKSQAGNALSLGRLGSGIVPFSDRLSANASQTARNLAISNAKKSVKLVQQDLFFQLTNPGIPFIPHDLLQALATVLGDQNKKVEVDIVLSHPQGKSGGGTSYGMGFSAHYVYRKIIRETLNRHPRVTGKLRIANLRFAESQGNEAFQWKYKEKTYEVGNHAKVFIIDDQAFCLGSDNAYPHNLQEFTVLIEDQQETAKFLTTYWNKVWKYSKVNAIENDSELINP